MSDQYRKQFHTVLAYFESEMEVLQDKHFKQEVKLLKKLIDYENELFFVSPKNTFFSHAIILDILKRKLEGININADLFVLLSR